MAGPPRHFEGVLACLNAPAMLRHRIAGKSIVVAEGPFGAIAQAMLCMPSVERDEFTISFAFPPAPANDCLEERQ
jgi:hypothetical protein